MGTSIRSRLLGILALGVLVAAGCSDKPASPKLSGAPPDFLAGVWDVIDTATLCGVNSATTRARKDSYTDTICIGGPDLAIANAQEAWDMYLKYEEFIPGKWTPLSFDFCSGFISESEFNVYCLAHASATLEECDFLVRISTRGLFDGNKWTMLRSVTRVEGEDCGLRHGDTATYCSNYVTTLTRVADPPEDCVTSDDVIGPVTEGD